MFVVFFVYGIVCYNVVIFEFYGMLGYMCCDYFYKIILLLVLGGILIVCMVSEYKWMIDVVLVWDMVDG